MTYWTILEELICSNKIKLEREAGAHHLKYKNIIYPVDYGFIENTKSMDGNGIDIFIGKEKEKKINGIICNVDKMKNDSELKIIYGCSDNEIETILNFLNNTDFMKAIFIRREENQ